MKIRDVVYGDMEIIEPVLLDLMQSKALARLRGISQFGIPDKYYFKINYNRYEHSVGVMLLLGLLGASLEEQVSGLLHDVSQFSFSHISDWIFADGSSGNESYHDTLHTDFVLQTDIPAILTKHGYSVDRVLDENNFPLLENNLPDVCADRLDYSLRELAHNGDFALVRSIITGVKPINGRIVFDSLKRAREFSDAFLNLQTTHWASEEGVTRYSLFSKAFKIAVKNSLIQHDDFWNKTEDDLIDILLTSGNLEILAILKRLEKGQLDAKTGERVHKKFRYVNPLVTIEGVQKHLSDFDPEYNQVLLRAKERNAQGVMV